MTAPEPGHVQVLARRKDGTLTRWTARFIDAGLISDLGQLCILGEAWHRDVTPAQPHEPKLTVLRGPDDIAAVCRHVGLPMTEHDPDGDLVWESTGALVQANASGWSAEIGGHGIDCDYGVPADVLFAALNAWGAGS